MCVYICDICVSSMFTCVYLCMSMRVYMSVYLHVCVYACEVWICMCSEYACVHLLEGQRKIAAILYTYSAP